MLLLHAEGKPKDQASADSPIGDYIYTEGRYRMLRQSDPEAAKFLLAEAQESVDHRWRQYKQLAEMKG